MQWGDLAVMELSSFQLEIMTCSPDVAVVLNITPNHLDRHGTMEAYTAAKAHILQHQSTDDCAVLGRDDPGAWSLAGLARGRLLSFGLAAPPGGQDGAYLDGERLMMQENGQATLLLTTADIRLRGAHNLLNVLAACTAALAAGLPVEALSTGVRGFGGVAHRLEFVRSWGGADWYNDSIATAPERAIAAIRAFDEPVVLLAGGRDKKLPWEAFAGLVRQRVDHLVVFGEAAGLVAAAVGGPGGRLRSVTRCAGLREAVQAAAALVEPGQVVLLAPGGTSFDEFTDFEERGEAFRKWVNELS
jgi:UDP-N-acetylmuramoylalanine--D-glutamate ligase